MIRHHVPPQLVVPGDPPPGPRPTKSGRPAEEPRCQVCDLRYSEHTGHTCAICRRPVEHHTDRAGMVDEIHGAARMALARLEAGRVTEPYEDWCINQSGIAPHTPKEVA